VAEEIVREDEEKTATALVTKTGKKKRYKPVDVSRVRCFNCQKFGHYKRDCQEEVTHKGMKRQTGDVIAMTAAFGAAGGEGNVTEELPGGAMAMAAVGRMTAGGGYSVWQDIDWVMDSGASQHILAEEAAAENMRASDEVVTLVDGSRVKAKGECDAKITTKVGLRLLTLCQMCC
jgi:hypothetical protein